MEACVPFNNYIVAMPSGDIKGFLEEERARIFIRGYYAGKVSELNDDQSMTSVDYATEPIQSTIDVCTTLGVNEGDCTLYDLDSFIENIRKSGIFEEEKEELISKLMAEEIIFNIYDLAVDDILSEALVLPHN